VPRIGFRGGRLRQRLAGAITRDTLVKLSQKAHALSADAACARNRTSTRTNQKNKRGGSRSHVPNERRGRELPIPAGRAERRRNQTRRGPISRGVFLGRPASEAFSSGRSLLRLPSVETTQTFNLPLGFTSLRKLRPAGDEPLVKALGQRRLVACTTRTSAQPFPERTRGDFRWRARKTIQLVVSARKSSPCVH